MMFAPGTRLRLFDAHVTVSPAANSETPLGPRVMLVEKLVETNVTAPHGGTVKNVHVKAGDSVKLNQVLVECE